MDVDNLQKRIERAEDLAETERSIGQRRADDCLGKASLVAAAKLRAKRAVNALSVDVDGEIAEVRELEELEADLAQTQRIAASYGDDVEESMHTAQALKNQQRTRAHGARVSALIREIVQERNRKPR